MYCSDLFLYNFEACQNLPYKNNLPGYKLYPFSCTSPYLRILSWAFSDPQRPDLPEIYPKIWKFWHCLNPKNVRFWTKKTHCVSTINHNSYMYGCVLLPWTYLWTNFQTRGTYGLPMTHRRLSIIFENFPSLNASTLPECLFNQRPTRGALEGSNHKIP